MDNITRYQHPLWGVNTPPVNKSNPMQTIADETSYEAIKQDVLNFLVSGGIQPKAHVNAFFALQRVEEYEMLNKVPEPLTLHSMYSVIFNQRYPLIVPLWKRWCYKVINLFKGS